MPNNTTGAIKAYFKNELKPYFDVNEIESMFYIVVEYYFDVKKKDVLLYPEKHWSESDLLKIIYCVKELKKQKPLAYIIGEWEFYGLVLNVTPYTLIPRPETEELVDLILKENNGNLDLLDIGTGSGCIPIAIKKHQPTFNVYAADVSSDALLTAKENASKNDVNIDFLEYDILKNKNEKFNKKLDVIVSNPPYIPYKDKEQMHKNVLEYEPHLALFVENNNPLLFYDAIADFGFINLKKEGKLYFEIHESMGDEVLQLLIKKGYKNVELIKDINEKDRIVKGILIN